VWISNPLLKGRRTEQEARPPFKRLLREVLASPEYAAQFGEAPIEFSSTYTRSAAASFEAAVKALRAYSQERNGATIVVAQTPFSAAVLRRKVPVLGSEFPVVRMASHRADQQYPTMQWHIHSARTVIERYLQVPSWMRQRLQCARYAHVPLGNLGDDPVCTMVDVSFARLMQHNRHLLWASESGHADLGGAEGDENDIWADEDRPEPVRVPGAYRSVCVELDVLNLCVDAIVASSQLDALDGGQGFSALDVNVAGASKGAPEAVTSSSGEGVEFGEQQQQQTGSVAIGDGAASASAFRVLKAMVQNWLVDVTKTGSPHADTLLIHLHRYLHARESLLYDPALKRVVAGLMRKVFLRLVSEVRRLGAEIVYADFGRMIIATNRTDLGQAAEYARFIMDTITASPIFEFIHIEPTKYWESLLFLDEQNYAGIEVSLQSLDDPAEISSSPSSSSLSSSTRANSSIETALARVVSDCTIDEDEGSQEADATIIVEGVEAQEKGGVDSAPLDTTAAATSAVDLKLKKPRLSSKYSAGIEGDSKLVSRNGSNTSADGDAAAYLLHVTGVCEAIKVEDKYLEDEAGTLKSAVLPGPGGGGRGGIDGSGGIDDDDDDDDDIRVVLTRRQRTTLHRRRAANSELSDSDSDESGGEEDPLLQHASVWENDADGVLHHTDNNSGNRSGDAGAVDDYDDESNNDGPRFDSHWDLAEYLPDEVREYFLIVVSQFLYKPWERAMQLKDEHEQWIIGMSNQLYSARDSLGGDSTSSTRDSFGGCCLPSQAQMSQTIDDVQKDDAETMRAFVKNLVSKKVLKVKHRAPVDFRV
jgi:hypothetical protein